MAKIKKEYIGENTKFEEKILNDVDGHGPITWGTIEDAAGNMTNEEKQLLLKDLCGRLPYGVIVDIKYNKEHGSSDRLRICSEGNSVLNTDILGLFIQDEIYLKPYLRPWSSITVEEICKIEAIIGNGFEYKERELMVCSEDVIKMSFPKIRELMEFLYQRHIDINDFILTRFAIEALEGMYNFK